MNSTRDSDLLAVDIGGTYLRWSIDHTIHRILHKRIDIQNYLNDLIKRHHIQKVAISFAGQVCCNKILSAPNLDSLSLALHAEKIVIENDLNCAAIAEAAAAKSSFLVALYSGTGLGAGVIERGELVRGFRNLAAEIGHIPYKKAPFRCGCGKDNCIELYASGSGIAKWARHLGCSSKIEQTCQEIKEAYLHALAHAAATLLSLFNPSHLVIGGGVVEHLPQAIHYIKTHIDRLAPSFSLEGVRIYRSSLQNAPLLGAKILGEQL